MLQYSSPNTNPSCTLLALFTGWFPAAEGWCGTKLCPAEKFHHIFPLQPSLCCALCPVVQRHQEHLSLLFQFKDTASTSTLLRTRQTPALHQNSHHQISLLDSLQNLILPKSNSHWSRAEWFYSISVSYFSLHSPASLHLQCPAPFSPVMLLIMLQLPDWPDYLLTVNVRPWVPFPNLHPELQLRGTWSQ